PAKVNGSICTERNSSTLVDEGRESGGQMDRYTCIPAPSEPAEETKADPFKALHDVISFSSMDFGSASDVAWMYGIVVGWDN
ncbi:hypothetical protein, partial [Staphylococcus aureus]|uniref:hypothetical protein n=1 Tax=Staphylococcus aureus TaxID=1280 RepID=UPI0038B3314F